MPVADWAHVFSGPLTRGRLDADYLANIHDYVGEFVGRISGFGRSGSFWMPG